VTDLPSRQLIEEAVSRHFETARARPGTTYDRDRFLAYLTHTPATKGRRVADTFAGRRRFVRFIELVQLDLGVCFTNAEWERGYSLDDFVSLVDAKVSKPDAAARLARDRVRSARAHLIDAPIKFGIISALLLVAAVFASHTAVRVLLAVMWCAITGGVAHLAWREYTYSRTLLQRIERGSNSRTDSV
jgi:hypothetical protein